MLSEISAYPTTIIIDKNKKVRQIFTGFNGPATGEKFKEFQIEFDNLLAELLNEE